MACTTVLTLARARNLQEGLGLPPAHVFGAGAVAFSIALSLCVLFPTQVESCTFVGIKGVFSKPLHLETFKELNAAWARPGDEDDFWDAADAMGMILLSKQMDKRHDVSDAVLGAFMRVSASCATRATTMADTGVRRAEIFAVQT